jgi:hypothetical protein
MIIQNILPKELEDEIYTVMTGTGFPWYWNAEQIVPETPDDHIFQLTHVFFLYKKVWSKYYNITNLMVGIFAEKTGIKIKRIVRIKGNLIPNISHTSESLDNLIHPDVDPKTPGNFISFIYYVMDSDGDTIILDDDKVTIVDRSPPVKGNCYWFDSKTYHRSTVPIDHKRRVVINFILEVE